MLRDLAAMAESELAAVQLATLDELTGISNRRGFIMLAQYSLHLCAREKLPAALVFLDLDAFKAINDTFGHAEGDYALTVMAEHLQRECRAADIIGRLGGDEFVVLLTNASLELAERVMARFSHSIETHNAEAKRGYRIAFSHGIVEFDHEKHETVEALLSEGDALMYESKKAKR